MALLTLIDGEKLAVVPSDTIAVKDAQVKYEELKGDKPVTTERKSVEALVVLNGHLPVDRETKELLKPKLHIATSSKPGVIFATVLLLIIVISNVPLRGLWSLIVILFIFLLVVILALANAWDPIL